MSDLVGNPEYGGGGGGGGGFSERGSYLSGVLLKLYVYKNVHIMNSVYTKT